MKNVTIYTTPTCGYCEMAKSFFQKHNVSYDEKDVSTDIAAQREMLEKSRQLGVPVIDVEGDIVVGFNESLLAQLLGVTG